MAIEDIPSDEELREAIRRNVRDGIRSVSVDGMSVQSLTPKEQLEVLKELETEDAASTNGFGIRITRLISAPPG